jgi:lipopolysaccharide export system protein LptA
MLSVLAGLALAQPAGAQAVDTKGVEAKTPKNVDIEADQMEILDAQKKAIFKGNVSAKRGNVTLKCDTLVVTYTQTAAKPDANGTQQGSVQAAAGADTQGTEQGGDKKTEVTFLDAEGNITILTQRQTVTGKTVHMDVKANKLWVKGGAKVVQGKTVMNGEQLFVDLNTNKSEMTGGRVKGSFVPGQ